MLYDFASLKTCKICRCSFLSDDISAAFCGSCEKTIAKQVEEVLFMALQKEAMELEGVRYEGATR